MKRFYCTDKKGQVVVESETTIIDTDDRVANFFKPLPNGFKRGYTEDGLPLLIEVPQPTQLELDLITLTNAKAKKISDINTQTGEAIVAKSGDIYKQLEKTIEHQILVRKKTDGEATLEDDIRIAELEVLSGEVLDLKYTGNNREEIVSLVELVTTLDEALAEIEVI